MPTLKLEIAASQEDVDAIRALAAAANAGTDAAKKERNARRFADRVRTVDQIKRLYAVVLGFALTSSIANAYLCERAVAPFSLEAGSIVVAPVISLASLMVLFALGAERFLDRTYLQAKSVVPTRRTLFFDLLTLGLTAALFVILSNIFQAPPASDKLDLGQLRGFQSHFINYLLGFYALDSICVGINLLRSWNESGSAGAHGIWLGLNLLCLVILFFGFEHIPDSPDPLFGVNWIAGSLIFLHIARFFLDYYFTFEFYYPKENME